MLKTSLKATYECTRAMGAADFTAEMARITPPALVIHGDNDASAPLERGRLTAAALANSELRIYEGAPHGLFMTHPERLNADLLHSIAASRPRRARARGAWQNLGSVADTKPWQHRRHMAPANIPLRPQRGAEAGVCAAVRRRLAAASHLGEQHDKRGAIHRH